MTALEPYLPYVLLAGLGIAALGFLAAVVVAFRTRVWWGVGTLVFPPAVLAFGWRHPQRAAWPLAVLALGIVLAAAPPIASRLIPIDLGPREKLVDGEVHVTLTGWDRKDYSVLRKRPGTVVLQMANPDVEDATLAHLRGMRLLRELDLNGTRVTDAGLETLASLEALETLRLRDTGVTDAGFRRWLAPKEGLRQLDLRGTKVEPATKQEWREAKPGRRVL